MTAEAQAGRSDSLTASLAKSGQPASIDLQTIQYSLTAKSDWPGASSEILFTVAELTQERPTFLMALCYRESQVRDLVIFFGALSKEQQYDSLTRLGFTQEQEEQAILNGELVVLTDVGQNHNLQRMMVLTSIR